MQNETDYNQIGSIVAGHVAEGVAITENNARVNSAQKLRLISRFGMIFLNLSLVSLIACLVFLIVGGLGYIITFVVWLFLVFVTIGLFLLSNNSDFMGDTVKVFGGFLIAVPYLFVFSLSSCVIGFILTRMGDRCWRKGRAGKGRLITLSIITIAIVVIWIASGGIA